MQLTLLVLGLLMHAEEHSLDREVQLKFFSLVCH